MDAMNKSLVWDKEDVDCPQKYKIAPNLRQDEDKMEEMFVVCHL